MDFGNKLKSLRNKHLLSQEDLAKTIGVSRSSIANYETNRNYPNNEILKKIASVFDVSMDYLLGDVTIEYPIKYLEDKLSNLGLSKDEFENSCKAIINYYSNKESIVNPISDSTFKDKKELLAFQCFFEVTANYLNCKLKMQFDDDFNLLSPTDEEKKELQKIQHYLSNKIIYIINSLNKEKILWNSSFIDKICFKYGSSSLTLLNNYSQLNDLRKEKGK